MPNFKSVLHFLLEDFGEGYLLVVVSCCDGGKTKSTPCPTDLDCTVRLDWSLTIENILWTICLALYWIFDMQWCISRCLKTSALLLGAFVD